MPEPSGMGTLDLSGLACPHVVLRLAEHMRSLTPGDRLRVIATDPLSAIDIPYFLDRTGHALLSRARQAGCIEFVVQAGSAAPQQPG